MGDEEEGGVPAERPPAAMPGSGGGDGNNSRGGFGGGSGGRAAAGGGAGRRNTAPPGGGARSAPLVTASAAAEAERAAVERARRRLGDAVAAADVDRRDVLGVSPWLPAAGTAALGAAGDAASTLVTALSGSAGPRRAACGGGGAGWGGGEARRAGGAGSLTTGSAFDTLAHLAADARPTQPLPPPPPLSGRLGPRLASAARTLSVARTGTALTSDLEFDLSALDYSDPAYEVLAGQGTRDPSGSAAAVAGALRPARSAPHALDFAGTTAAAAEGGAGGGAPGAASSALDGGQRFVLRAEARHLSLPPPEYAEQGARAGATAVHAPLMPGAPA
ncbi:hypothetical protein MNEG_5479 [Monoraphidium neglectum]|uniref:Uncharacterized protein n=1 Tax=Monoraphidium neglectum TaxID=145388 RepID=A0A0D2L687_9CHLO|nr:hypothetical protein MNEG_5479 [Monoraphidium neglectum]KIZ02484.1 hypothetical protein MNEG_5479 [Monoraphidium neglectum]|eukprot:XP_013901503.1 hypothetical protein MNEG_5479 [Monoraphidium neglectum]